MITLEAENLVKTFNDKSHKREVPAVDDISFSINAGEIFGFLGPNGAGKTTTIRLLAGLYRPTSGRAKLYGQDVAIVGDRIRKDIGFLTENHGNYENLTVYENLKFFGGFYGLSNLENRIKQLLEEFGLSERQYTRVGKLSKGLKQRLALARVLLHDPKILFLDEPTAGLDPQAAVEVRVLITRLRLGERTIFVNSHNLEEVQKICDRVAIINAGKIVQIGTAAQLDNDLFGAQELSIQVKETLPANLVAELQRLTYVKSLQANHTRLTMHLVDIDVNAPDVIECLTKGGAKILEVQRARHSLEEIYLALIADTRNTAGRGE
ncbi:MAG: ABC transporter ATP-binding protein [Promethearchaeota archaeon CR_4]|nr:MAG: ABC transporter ATP-binding protein [Candidatus Lokiarchaeota archaeon CR_4]